MDDCHDAEKAIGSVLFQNPSSLVGTALVETKLLKTAMQLTGTVYCLVSLPSLQVSMSSSYLGLAKSNEPGMIGEPPCSSACADTWCGCVAPHACYHPPLLVSCSFLTSNITSLTPIFKSTKHVLTIYLKHTFMCLFIVLNQLLLSLAPTVHER